MMVRVLREPITSTEPWGLIPLGHNQFAIVDLGELKYLTRWKWQARKSAHNIYVSRHVTFDGKDSRLFMHRELMHPKPGEVVHHLNGNTFDNRKVNLVCLTKKEHDMQVTFDKARLKYTAMLRKRYGVPADSTSNSGGKRIIQPQTEQTIASD